MTILKNKSASAIAMIFISAFAISLVAFPVANAHTPKWAIISYAYIVAAPDPVGVGQTVSIVMWIDVAMPSATVANDIRRHDYKLTITRPDGTTEVKDYPVVTDTTSIQYLAYTPTQVGTYTLKFEYPGQTYTWSGAYQNDTFTAASKTITLTVQAEPLPAPRTSYPLPTEYWARPIEGQNTDWYAISSNWLSSPYILGGGAGYGIPGGIQLEGTAPNSAHVMWTKPIQYGGVVGGEDVGVEGNTFYTGGSYNVRYSNPLIMYGTLYYQEPYGNSGSGGAYVAVDLRTGEEQWRVNVTASGISLVPSFGYLYDLESPNQHGIIPNGWLIATSGTSWRAYDPRNGVLSTLNITGIPSGAVANLPGPQGEYLKVILANTGTTASPAWRLMQWNSSKVFVEQTSGTINASLPSRYDWNISVSLGPGTWSIAQDNNGVIKYVEYNNIMLLYQGSFGGHVGDFSAIVTDTGANLTAISLKPETRGQVLWTKYYPPAPGNNTRAIVSWDPAAGVFLFEDKESKVHYGYSLTDGSYIWGPTEPANDYTYLIGTTMVAYGKAYFTGYGGIVYCYDVKTGELLWTYGNGGSGNSTSSGLETAWGRYPIFVDVIADGKVYLSSTEHSPNTPLYKDMLFRCINATDGKEIWTLLGSATNMYGGTDPVADGFFVFLNTYDMQLYCVGKGPSATTIEAPMTAITLGSSLVIRGTITDVSAGTEQHVVSKRFPNGVPAVSDASMGRWMEYVYMQKPRPTDATGVEVTISVLDSNNNYREIGTTTSNSDGFFTFNWKPDIEGQYTVYASFAGSESYWPSHAVTSFAVDPAPPVAAEPEPEPQSIADQYFLPGVAIIVAAIAIVGAVVVLMLRKR